MARRVARRRAELGKSIEEVASVAGIDPEYLRYFEKSADGAAEQRAPLLLLALALECTPEDLSGGRIDRPPGRGRAGRHPAAAGADGRAVPRPTCGRVGWVGWCSARPRGPVAHPLNFVVERRRRGRLARRRNTPPPSSGHGRVSFEIDRVDEAISEGWSVLVTGAARRVDDPKEVASLDTLGLAPWAGGPRHAIVRHPVPTW